jgi:TfoX/Sxy family transcriptional regulator of competence genes
MKMEKSPPGLVETFAAALPDDPRVERRQMFGYPCAFAGGNMFAGLFADDLWVRVEPARRAELIGQGWKLLEPMPGRPMKDYLVVPPATVDDRAALTDWVARALEYTSTLPPKEKKPPKAKKR